MLATRMFSNVQKSGLIDPRVLNSCRISKNLGSLDREYQDAHNLATRAQIGQEGKYFGHAHVVYLLLGPKLLY
jgi:hypothetical protein